jgi:GNAT superfamily N-acetyltransferase
MDRDAPKEDNWITDARGQRYRLQIDDETSFWRVRVLNGQIWVAEANCQVTDTALTLHDLHVFDKVLSPDNGLIGWIRGFIKGHNKPVNYRGRGLGSALLKFITNTASQRGLREINGSLSRNDLKENPNLANWYQRRGFEVAQGGNFGAGKIHLVLLPHGKQRLSGETCVSKR